MTRVILTRKFANFINGVDLRSVKPGDSLSLSASDARILIAEGWATPDAPGELDMRKARSKKGALRRSGIRSSKP